MIKKRLLAAALALCVLLSGLALAETDTEGMVAKVTTPKGALNLRAKPSSAGAVKGEIPNGSCLLVLEEGPEWCLCQWQGETGYCSAAYLTILREADAGMLAYRALRQGDRGEDVLRLKARLQELGYIRAGSTLTEAYNDILAERITLFQRQMGVTEDGVASQELQSYLFSDQAPRCSQTLPPVRSQVKRADQGQRREICGCCMGEGCECCGFTDWSYY